VTWPIEDLRSYYVALHEFGHAATWTLETKLSAGVAARAVAARVLLGEARASAWALDTALVRPDSRTELAILEALTWYIEAHGGNVGAGGVELVAAEHVGEYSRIWARCPQSWTWDRD